MMPEQPFDQWILNASKVDLCDQLTMGRCRLLATAVENGKVNLVLSKDGKSQDHLREGLRVVRKEWQKDLNGNKIAISKPVFDGFDLLASRLQLIHGYKTGFATDPNHADSLTAIVSYMVESVRTAWDYICLPKVKKLDDEIIASQPNSQKGRLEPSFMRVLETKDSRLAEGVRSLAMLHGWSHPGFLLAGEILAAMLGDTRQPELTIETKLLFAVDHPNNPKGIAAQLIVERLPDGCGSMIPDAYHCGYLWMPDGSFSTGIQNAWLAARTYLEQNFQIDDMPRYDWRWRIGLLGAVEQLKWKDSFLPIFGRSAEVATACALIGSARENPDNIGGFNPLDPNVAVSAKLDADEISVEGTKRWQLSDDATLPIRKIAEVKTKTLLGLKTGILLKERLGQLVVSDQQPDDTLPKNDGSCQFTKCGRLASAYEQLSRFPRITRGVNRLIAQAALRAQQQWCTPYIEPEVADVTLWQDAVRNDPKVYRVQPPDDAKLPTEDLYRLTHGLLNGPLSPSELSAPATDQPSRLQGNRIFIEADSGMGKSMFLLNCQRQIANSENLGLLPIRFGRTLPEDNALSQLDWKDLDAGKLLSCGMLAELTDAFDKHLQRTHQTRLNENDWSDWMEWMICRHRIVFLLDALDQTNPVGVELLGGRLAEKHWRHCPVILTGRPEAKFDRKSALQGNQWHKLRLVPFDATRWNRYLGTYEAEKMIDEAILSVPLMLSMLKLVLPRESDGSLNLRDYSRNALYNDAINTLIDKGFNSSEGPVVRRVLINETKTKVELGRIAWKMYQIQGFENNLHGEDFDRLEMELGADYIDALHAIDIATSQQLIDSRGRKMGLAFRHRSFFEYFLAYHLGRMPENRVNETSVSNVFYLTNHQMAAIIERIRSTEAAILENNYPVNWSLEAWQGTLRFLLSMCNHKNNQLVNSEYDSWRIQLRDRSWLVRQLIESGIFKVLGISMFIDKVEFIEEIKLVIQWIVGHRNCFGILRNTSYSHLEGAFCNTWNRRLEYSRPLSKSERKVRFESTIATAKTAWAKIGLDSSKTLSNTQSDLHLHYSIKELLEDSEVVQHSDYFQTTSRESSLLERLQTLPCDTILSTEKTWNPLESFVLIKGGIFKPSDFNYRNLWGKDYGENDYSRRAHSIVDSFEMADFPITIQTHYLLSAKKSREPFAVRIECNLPKTMLSWAAADELCYRLSELTNRKYRLPTIVEWEYACRWLCGEETERCIDNFWWGPDGYADFLQSNCIWNVGVARAVPTPSGITLKRLRSRCEAIRFWQETGISHPSWVSPQRPGLLDILGYPDELCQPSEKPVHRLDKVPYKGPEWRGDFLYFSAQSTDFVNAFDSHRLLGCRLCRDCE